MGRPVSSLELVYTLQVLATKMYLTYIIDDLNEELSESDLIKGIIKKSFSNLTNESTKFQNEVNTTISRETGVASAIGVSDGYNSYYHTSQHSYEYLQRTIHGELIKTDCKYPFTFSHLFSLRILSWVVDEIHNDKCVACPAIKYSARLDTIRLKNLTEEFISRFEKAYPFSGINLNSFRIAGAKSSLKKSLMSKKNFITAMVQKADLEIDLKLVERVFEEQDGKKTA